VRTKKNLLQVQKRKCYERQAPLKKKNLHHFDVICQMQYPALEMWNQVKATHPIKSERFLWVTDKDGNEVRLSCKRHCANLFGISPATFCEWARNGKIKIICFNHNEKEKKHRQQEQNCFIKVSGFFINSF
jgi:hypothetical protein